MGIGADGMLPSDATGPSTFSLLLEYMQDRRHYPHKSVAILIWYRYHILTESIAW